MLLRTVCCFSLCVLLSIPTMAYTDDSTIVQSTAVKACTELGILDGRDDGSFGADALLTYGEMAKLIAAINGIEISPTYLTGLFIASPDIAAKLEGHWAGTHIIGCRQRNLFPQLDEAAFHPDGSVTRYELARTLLKMLDYRDDIEGFSQADWTSSVAQLVGPLWLFAGLGSDDAAPLTRGEAVQMIWTALNTSLIKYEYQIFSVDGVLQTKMLRLPQDTTLKTRFFPKSTR